MSARSFGSLFMVASCAGAALGCYLVSLRVASERASLEDVETKIVLAQRDMRMIQTEIGTRGRLSQLERWNAGAFSLSAPAANQFLEGSFQLAQLVQPQKQADFSSQVVLASAPAPSRPAPIGQAPAEENAAPVATTPGGLLHQASLKTETREVPARTVVTVPQTTGQKSADKPVTAAKPAQPKSADKPGLAAAHPLPVKTATAKPAAAKPAEKKTVDKPTLGAAKPMTKHVELAKNDPLASVPAKHSGKTKDAPPAR
jgi:transposase